MLVIKLISSHRRSSVVNTSSVNPHIIYPAVWSKSTKVNLEDAKGGRLSGGLLQLNLGGGGNLFNIGQGGWSTSIDTIAAAMGGLDEIRRVSRAKIAGEDSHALGVLNMVNYQATGGDYRLARDIWNRNIKVAFEDLGRTAYGLYRHRKTPDTIVVNQRYNTNDREDAAVLASAGSHEGQHLYDRRDLGYTTEAEAHTRGRQTYMNLLEILELKGNTGLMSAIMSGILDPESYEKNTGDVDYLKLTKNGLLVDDGQANLVDEDGKVLISFEAMGLESNEDVLGALRELNILPDDVMGNMEAGLYQSFMNANNGEMNAPEEMLFLLGARAEYNIRLARGLIDTYTLYEPRRGILGGLIDNAFGMRHRKVTLGFDGWMSKRVNADNFDRLNLEYPTGNLGPWKGLGPDGLLTCTDCSGYRNSNLIAQLTNMTTDGMQQRVEEEGLMNHIYQIANSRKWDYPSGLRGNNIGSVLAMMGLGDGVRQYTVRDIQSGAIHPGAIATIWKQDFYNKFRRNTRPGSAGWGHTGSVGRIRIVNNENTSGIRIPWVDQYNGAALNHWTIPFPSNNNRRNISVSNTVLLGTHVYNDITPYQFDLGLLKLKTTLYDYSN